MKINIQLFAGAKDAAGTDVVQLTVPENTTVSELRQHLITVTPALTPLKESLLVAVNNQYADAEHTVQATDEVACFPPVSGG